MTRSTLRKLLLRLEHEEIYDILHGKANVTDDTIVETIKAMFMRNPFEGEVDRIRRLLGTES